MSPPVLVTTQQLADAFGVSADVVLRLEKEGQITPLMNRGTKNRRWHVETCLAQMRKQARIEVQDYMTPIFETTNQ